MTILFSFREFTDSCFRADMVQIGRTLYKPFFTMLASNLGLNLSARIRTQVSHLLYGAYIGQNYLSLLRRPILCWQMRRQIALETGPC